MTKTFEALASGETLEIRIYGAIGAGLFFNGATAQSVSDAIKYTQHKRIVLKINSPGGDAFEGMAIRNILASQEVETVAEIEGRAASAASIAAMGCKTIRMFTGSAMMIHEASGMPAGPMDSRGVKKLAAALETLNDGMAALYAQRTGMSKKKCRELMADETWLSADQAVKQKFADEVVAEKREEALKVAASFDWQLFGYRKVPARFKAANKDSAALTEPPKLGDRIYVDPARAHMPDASGYGTVEIIASGPVLGIRFDQEPDEIHKWYTADEVQDEATEEPEAATAKKMKMSAEALMVGASFSAKLLASRDDIQPILPPAPTQEPDEEDDDDQDDDADGGDTQPDVQPVTKEDLREAMESLAARQQVPPLSAAQNAEASATRMRLDTMTIKLIAAAAGLPADAEESAVITAVSQLHAFVGELKTLTKAQSTDAVLGAIRGLQAAADQLPVLTAKVDEQAKALEQQERAQLIAADKADPKGRKLTPALEAMWASQPLDAFKAFLAAAPHIIQMQGQDKGQQQPALQSTEAAASGSTFTSVVKHDGKAFEDMTPGELHNIKFSGDEGAAIYDALYRNYVERGRPRAQGQQQRASA